MSKHFRETKKVLFKGFQKIIENITSKKFIVFITATVLLYLDVLPTNDWLYIALAVLGVVSAIEYTEGRKNNGIKNRQSDNKTENTDTGEFEEDP